MSRTFSAAGASLCTTLLLASVSATELSPSIEPASAALGRSTIPPPPTATGDALGDMNLIRGPRASATVTVHEVSARYTAPTHSIHRVTPPSSITYLGPQTGSANGFYYGYCTWWVAHKRYVPWRGDAWAWWPNARRFGYAEGATPRVGAIAVIGIGPWTPAGHVAFVERVNADGSFVISEMNWGRWGVVDLRTVTSMRGIEGFIY